MKASFDRDPMFLLHDVARIMRTKFDQRAREHGMTRAQWVILLRLERQPGMSQNEMAAVCEVEPITVARLVDRLERCGMVERRPDANDRRINRLHLLPAATPLLREIGTYRDQMTSELLDGLDGPELDAFVDVLLHLKCKLTAEGASAPKLQLAGE